MSNDILDGEFYIFDEVCVPVTYYQKMSKLDYRISKGLTLMRKEEKEELLNIHIVEVLKHHMKEENIRDMLFDN